MSGCATFDASAPYALAVLGFTDCHALALSAAGWNALAGSPAITALMVVAVALLGYRLLLGEGPGPGEAAGFVARFALVLALVGQWPAWQALVFDVATQGPQSLASAILPASGLAGADQADLAARLQGVSDALAAMGAPANAPALPISMPPSPAAPWVPHAFAEQQPAPAPALTADQAHLLAADASGVLAAGLAGLVAVRIAVALLLALGPVFLGFLLFATTRGIFLSWARVLGGVALAAVAMPAMLALSLAMIEPQVAVLGSLVAAGADPGALPGEIGASITVLAIGELASAAALVAASAGLRWPGPRARSQAPFFAAGRAPRAEAAPPPWPHAAQAFASDAARVRRSVDAALAMRTGDGGTAFSAPAHFVAGARAHPATETETAATASLIAERHRRTRRTTRLARRRDLAS